jgi:hypothetical protein
MPDLLQLAHSNWKLLVLALAIFGIQLAYWKADRDFREMIRHTSSERSAPFQDVVMTNIMTASNRTQNLILANNRAYFALIYRCGGHRQ